MLTAAKDLAASIVTTMVPAVVSNVAFHTEVAGMQLGGALVNSTTRLDDPAAGGQVGATAVVVSGWVVGGATVVVVEPPAAVVVVAGAVVVVDVPPELCVVVVVDDPFFEPWPLTRNTTRTTTAPTTAISTPRRSVVRRLRLLAMTACFCSLMARWRARFSLGTVRHATQPWKVGATGGSGSLSPWL